MKTIYFQANRLTQQEFKNFIIHFKTRNINMDGDYGKITFVEEQNNEKYQKMSYVIAVIFHSL